MASSRRAATAPSDRSRRRRSLGLSGLVAAAIVFAAVVAAVRGSVATSGASVTRIVIASRFVRAQMPVTLVAPRGGGHGRPLLVFLHGRGGDQDSELHSELFAALAALGARAPDIAFPDGGDHSYWHNRAGGAGGSYVLREVIPAAVRALGADGGRVAIGGISMGGFGAFDLARLEPGRFCAVGGHSAALWPAAADTAPGAFDDAADFARNDVIRLARTEPRLFRGARVWLDGGNLDPFHVADEELAAALHVRMHVWPGGHDSAYWLAHWRSYLGFYASALAACRERAQS